MAGVLSALFMVRFGLSPRAVDVILQQLFPALIALIGILIAALTIFGTIPGIKSLPAGQSAFDATIRAYRVSLALSALLATGTLLGQVSPSPLQLAPLLTCSVLFGGFCTLVVMLLGLVRATTEALGYSE